MKEIILGICYLALIFSFVILIKNNVTLNNHTIVGEAILAYRLHCIHNHTEAVVDWDDEESYNKTLFRIWDWGYTRILPPDKFEIIKPFIKK